MFTIDGLTWDIPCTIERTAEMTPSEISGMMLDKSYFNDVLGTYMSYTISIAVPLNTRGLYTQIYEIITTPADAHVMTLPYNDDTITITARITDISDVYVRLENGENYWRGIRFTAVSNYPSKEMTLGEVIERGMTPYPPINEAQIGDAYQWTANGWVETTSLPNAELMAFPRGS